MEVLNLVSMLNIKAQGQHVKYVSIQFAYWKFECVISISMLKRGILIPYILNMDVNFEYLQTYLSVNCNLDMMI